MSGFEQVDYGVWLIVAAVVFLPYALLAMMYYRSLRRIEHQFSILRHRMYDLSGLRETDRLNFDSEWDAVAGNLKVENGYLRTEIEKLRLELEADVCELAEAVLRMEERVAQGLTREDLSDVPSKAVLYTLRTDVEKLTAEVQSLRSRLDVRAPHEHRPKSSEPDIERQSAEIEELRAKLLAAEKALVRLKHLDNGVLPKIAVVAAG
jgi:hypothetical protein